MPTTTDSNFDADADADRPDGWPTPTPDQVRVLLFGTYHMDNPGLDEANVEADDVLRPERQSELDDLVDVLAPWDPDRVAVERPYDRHDALDEAYDRYRSGERDYDDDAPLGPFHPDRDDPAAAPRSEVVQVGFRLAERCGHSTVYPVDVPTTLGNEDLAALEESSFEPERKTAVDLPDLRDWKRRSDRRLAESTLVEFHRELNRDPALRVNHGAMFGDYVRRGRDDNFGGPDAIATWYERNLRIVHNLWCALRSGDDRLFLLVGNGHVRALRHLLAETPQFAPVSPLPLLADG